MLFMLVSCQTTASQPTKPPVPEQLLLVKSSDGGKCYETLYDSAAKPKQILVDSGFVPPTADQCAKYQKKDGDRIWRIVKLIADDMYSIEFDNKVPGLSGMMVVAQK